MIQQWVKAHLQRLKQESLLRGERVVDTACGAEYVVSGKKVISFCSNDYLGLGHERRVVEAAAKAGREFGWSTVGSRLLSGTTRLHRQLEEGLAAFKKKEAAILFGSGYLANVGAIPALAPEGGVIFADQLNHASLIDGCRLSRARVVVYPHRDMQVLAQELEQHQRLWPRIIITDGVFSMDGDIAPLDEICALAERFAAAVYVDDAHGTGVLGAGGRGVAEHCQVEEKVDVCLSTLSKSLACLGGIISGSTEVIEYLRNRARSFIYTTSFPAPLCAAALAALRILQTDPGPRRRLWENTDYFKRCARQAGIALPDFETPIVPVLVGNSGRALRISARLWECGFYIPAIRPPTVPEGKARLRLTITALHTNKQIEQLVEVLAHSLNEPE
jgi:8-amino-7-oxononanoate synthase